MTEEELREKIAQYITGIIMRIEQQEWHYNDWPDALPMSDQILTLFRKAGWKSPEEVDNIKGLIKQLRDNSEEDYGAYGFHVQSKAAWTALMNVLKK